MPNLTQLGSALFLGSTYSVVVYTDDHGQTWVANHTDKTRNYKTDWSAEKVAAAIEGRKNVEKAQDERDKAVRSGERHRANQEHNRLAWYKRMQKKK